jgi:uncharacterized protein with von Willebrand factor type A (vWA) domain
MPPEPDVALLAARFGRAVHDAGIPCSPERSVRFARALALTRPASRERLYWTARAVFVSAHGQAAAFDAVFARVFDGLVDPASQRGDQHAPPPPGSERGNRPPPPGAPRTTGRPGAAETPRSSSPTAAPPGDDAGADQVLAVAVAAGAERLATKDFARLDADELLALRRLMSRLEIATPLRRTRRARRARRGDHLDVRATLRASHRTGGDPVRQVRRRRRKRHRSLVVLCDVSGSMEPYSRAFLLFLHGAVGGAHAEAFVFATRLTRLTRALRGPQPDLAIAAAAAAAPDWSGGTRIGAALAEFNDKYGRRGLARGAVVVIVSDGWEVGYPQVVAREMARLRRLAHRIVWVNPRKAAPDFRPTAGGMAAALPSVDALVGGHDLLALGDALAAIGGRPATTTS